MFRVIHRFADMQDQGRIYYAGDTFPRDDAPVSAKRVEELSSNKNRLGVPLIEEVGGKPKRKPKSK